MDRRLHLQGPILAALAGCAGTGLTSAGVRGLVRQHIPLEFAVRAFNTREGARRTYLERDKATRRAAGRREIPGAPGMKAHSLADKIEAGEEVYVRNFLRRMEALGLVEGRRNGGRHVIWFPK